MAGYTRQDTGNTISPGSIADPDVIDAEYDQIQAAFNASSGHKHDGTAAEGPPIEVLGPSQEFIANASAFKPKTDNTYSLGLSGERFSEIFTVDADLSGDLTVAGNIDLSSDLTITGNTDLNGTLDVAGNTSLNGTLTVADDATLSSELVVTGNATLSSDLGVTGNANLNSDLTVVGNAGLNGTLAVTGNADLDGDLDVAGNVDLNSTLDVTGNVTLSNDLGVAGNVDISSTLDVTGDTTLSNTLDVTGNTTLSSDLDVVGSTTLSSTLDVTGNATLSSNLDVTGSTDLSGGLAVTGNATLSNDLDVTGNTTLSSDLGVTGNTDLNGTLDVAGNVTLSSDLDVTGNTDLNGDLTVTGTLVTGNVEMQSPLDMGNNYIKDVDRIGFDNNATASGDFVTWSDTQGFEGYEDNALRFKIPTGDVATSYGDYSVVRQIDGDDRYPQLSTSNTFTDNQTATRFRADGGGQTQPEFAFFGDGSWNTGLWESGGNRINFGTLGVTRASLNDSAWRLHSPISNVQFDRTGGATFFDWPNRDKDTNDYMVFFRSSDNTTRYAMRADGAASFDTDIVTVGSGDGRYATLSSGNTFTDNQIAPRWRASSGGASLPGFAFEGNGSWNTGLFESGGTTLGFTVLGSSRMDVNSFRVSYKSSITNLQFERSDAGVNFDFPNRANNEPGLMINFRSSGNTSRYTMRADGSLNASTDIINRGNGDGRYAQLDDDNTFTGLCKFSSDASTSQIRLENTGYSGDPNNIGQRSDGRLRLTSGSGFVYDVVDEGQEDNFSLIRRKYADTRYAQLGAENTFSELTKFGDGVRANFGSASLPSYAFDGDINTGLFIVEQNVLGVAVNGQLRYRFDFSGFNQDEDVVTKARADTNYARLSEPNVFSGDSADTFEGADSTKHIKVKNTGESDPAFIGQKAGMGIRMITGSATASGTVYDCEQAGSEGSNTVLRRTYADGRYQQSSSDEALKYDIESMGDVGAIIDELRPVTYLWKENENDPKPEGVQYGAIAQEVEEVLPSAVQGEDGDKGIDLRPVVWALVKEVQSLRARVQELEGAQG